MSAAFISGSTVVSAEPLYENIQAESSETPGGSVDDASGSVPEDDGTTVPEVTPSEDPAPAGDDTGIEDPGPSEPGTGEGNEDPAGDPQEGGSSDPDNKEPGNSEEDSEDKDSEEKPGEKTPDSKDGGSEEKTTDSEDSGSDDKNRDSGKESSDKDKSGKSDNTDKSSDSSSDKKSDESAEDKNKKATDDSSNKTEQPAADAAVQPEEEAPTGSNVPVIPRMIFNYSVRHFEKIDAVYIICKADSANIREEAYTSSMDSIVAKFSRGAIARLIDESDPAQWYIETRDTNGKIIRGYADSSCFKKLSKNIKKVKENPSKIMVVKDTNAGFDAVGKTTFDELSLTGSISDTREDLVSYALQFLGKPYLKGGESLTEGINSPFFAREIYAEFGIPLPGKYAEQLTSGTEIPVKDAQPGDLIFYSNGKPSKQTMLCLSNDGKGHIQVVLPSSDAKRIIVTDLDTTSKCTARTFEQLNLTRTPDAGMDVDLSEWTLVGNCRLTSYCYKCNTPANSAITASGIPASEWHTVAVDSSVIPLGSRVYIEGYGVFVAEDTGVKGNWCDLYVYHNQCNIWDIATVYYLP